jgi:hypothetical protein
MNLLVIIFFLGVAVSLVVLKGLFMSQEFAVKTRRVRKARRADRADND